MSKEVAGLDLPRTPLSASTPGRCTNASTCSSSHHDTRLVRLASDTAKPAHWVTQRARNILMLRCSKIPHAAVWIRRGGDGTRLIRRDWSSTV